MRERRLHLVPRTLLLIGLTFLFLFPVLWTLSISIKPNTSIFTLPPDWIFRPIAGHFESAFAGQGAVLRDLGNSALIASSSTLLVIAIGTPAAYALSRLSIRRRDDFMLFILASRMAPPVALLIPYFLIYNELGLLETHFGLIIAYLTFNLSFYVWLLSIFFKEIPPDLESAGQLDGQGPFYTFVRIILPLMKSSIIATSVLVFIFAWNEFAFAFLIGGRGAETLPVGISRFITPRGVQFGELAAVGAVALVPVAVLVFLLHKHIIRGLSLGAVKG